jgi:hypothetical protein
MASGVRVQTIRHELQFHLYKINKRKKGKQGSEHTAEKTFITIKEKGCKKKYRRLNSLPNLCIRMKRGKKGLSPLLQWV